MYIIYQRLRKLLEKSINDFFEISIGIYLLLNKHFAPKNFIKKMYVDIKIHTHTHYLKTNRFLAWLNDEKY